MTATARVAEAEARLATLDARFEARLRELAADISWPVAREWEDRIYRAGEIATRDGSTWQAVSDTGHPPPHENWTCLAACGSDGREITPRGTYDEAIAYRRLDVVALNGGSFIALRDDPGPCPGEGWQLLASRGKAGKPGDPGHGLPGKAAPTIVGGNVDPEGLMVLKMSDGTAANVDLYPVLSKLPIVHP
jgi:hypothetical protein